jgi:D-sedoheptulose 7-phosphate isomerase
MSDRKGTVDGTSAADGTSPAPPERGRNQTPRRGQHQDGTSAALPRRGQHQVELGSRHRHDLERIFHDDPRPASFAKGYLAYLTKVLAQLDEKAIAAFIEALLDARARGAHIFFIGNGGSAATASHFANDIAIGSRSRGKPFRALSLVDNLPLLTAVANDDGYDEVFTAQLKLFLKAGDLVVAISASGNSPNVVKAVEYANAHGATTVALTGFDGGQLKCIAKLGVHVPTAKGEYGPTEDAHMVLDHLVGAFLIELCRGEGEL